jgi:DNA-3-methyladenine glycosylase II
MDDLHRRNGPPPRWARPPSFATLVLFVLEQQVSLASAKAALVRLQARLGRIEPEAFLTLDDAALRATGFSRQKASYCRGLAAAMLDGSFDPVSLAALDDDEARRALTALRGIGPWTADVYLLFVLGRPDAWPEGDRALQVAVARALARARVPTAAEAAGVAERWRPWRAVAASFLWHDYLGGRAYQDDGVVADILG